MRARIFRGVGWLLVPVGLVGLSACAKTVLPPGYIATAPPAAIPSAPPPDERDVSRNATAARMATVYLGAPYVWAGASPAGFDCSGLVSYVYARVGVSIPHNAAQQYQYGAPVTREQLQAGDVVFFNHLRHNGIYLGDGRFVHAASPGGVRISRLDDDWFRTRWVGARRL
ncbi:MAG TPA: C40 family peptidase [Gemmatimonadales bacterium]|nr:C40 family peptidase [Gemmatimonadales bacterium]